MSETTDAYLWKSHKCVDLSAEMVYLEIKAVSFKAKFQMAEAPGACHEWQWPLDVRV